MKLLNNASYHVPVIGSIRLGGSLDQDGKPILYQNDFFLVTENHKKNGEWVEHPIQHELLDQLTVKANGRLAEIPVKVVFSDPNLNTSERFESYDPVTKKLQCVGDGSTAIRVSATGDKSKEQCAGPEYCQFAMTNACRLMSRTTLQIRGQSDELGVFMLRSSGYNSMTTLRTRLELMYAKFGKALRYIPLKLILRAKSSVASEDMVFYYPDLVVDGNEVDVAVLANSQMTREKNAGINMDSAETRMTQLKEHDPFMTWNDDLTDVTGAVAIANIKTNESKVDSAKGSSEDKTSFALALSKPFDFESNKSMHVSAQPAVEMRESQGQDTDIEAEPTVQHLPTEMAATVEGKNLDAVETCKVEENKLEVAKVIMIHGENRPKRISKTRNIPKVSPSFH